MKNSYTRSATVPRGIGICFLSLTLFLLLSFSALAQQNVPVTGFNSDQVAEGVGVPTTTSTAGTDGGVDNGGYVFIDGTYKYDPSCAVVGSNVLPANNQITSAAVPGLTYVLQPYSANNALRVPATGVAAGSGTFTLTTPISAGALYLLCVAGGGAINSGITVTVTFTDATTQTFTNYTASDWCNATNATNYTKIATTQYNRVQATTVANCFGYGTCQYFAEMALAIDAANQSKLVSSITVNKTTSTNVMNVYAVGMVPPCTTPLLQPSTLTATVTSTGFISASFIAPSPAPSGYLVVKYAQGATPTAPVTGVSYSAGQALGTGTVVQASSATTFTASQLIPNTSYDFYVYAYNGPCAPTSANPSYLTTTPLMSTLTTNACGGTLSGTISVGPGGTYSNLTSAMSAIANLGLAGNTILELQPGYDASTETYPISFLGDPCASASKSLTIRPSASNITPLVITSNNATATFDFNGARNIMIDGRPGGTGSAKMLSIINTNSAGVALRFVADASVNTVQYCDIQGENTSATTAASSAQVGVISFGTANGAALNGNDSNTISYCDIHATATGFPAIAIASYGNDAASPAAAWNDDNVIDHCNIFDFFSATLASCAIKAHGGSNRFVVSNNHVYQTASRTYSTANNQRAFWLTPSASGASGFRVINNFIGGNDSLGNGTYTMLGGSVATNYWGMDINHSGSEHTSVQGNTITNISLANTTSTATPFRGITTGNNGHMDIGTVTGNTIGSAAVNGAISISGNNSGGTVYGIHISGSTTIDSIRVYNNTIGGITVTSPNTNIGIHLQGIGITGAYCSFVHNNHIGSTINASSMISANPVTTAAQSVYGIFVSSGTYTSVSGNTVHNLTNASTSTSTSTNTSYTRGISLISSSTSIVTGNTVKNIATGSISTSSNGASTLVGIAVNTSNPSTVTNNTVDSLVLTTNSSNNATNMDGMVIGLNGSSPTHVVSGNFIHHLIAQRPSGGNVSINGMNLIGGSCIVMNNMIQLGLNPDGTSYDSSVVIRGLYLNNTTANNIFHNSVYIGGSAVTASAKNSHAFVRGSASGTQQIRNNIFVNERSNTATGGKHYQIFLNNATGLSLSNNIYYGTGAGNLLGTFNNGSTDVATIASGWLSTDTNSVAGNPRFITPNGSSATVNLHISTSIATPVESAGMPLAGVTQDYDGDDRSINTPVDIGADAGLFTLIGMSIDSTTVEQVTTGTLIGAVNQQVIAVKVYTKGVVNPLDLTALKLNTSGTSSTADVANAKVFYTGGSNVFSTANQFGSTVNTPAGTFYATGTQTLAAGVNYFWVAYDVSASAVANNVIDARLDSVGIAGNVSANILNGDPVGNRLISAPLSGNYNVGLGQTYATITAALADLNLLGVGAPVTFTLTDASYTTVSGETFPIVLGAFQGASASNTVTFKPGAGVTAAISGSVANNPIIKLDGGKYYVIDGRQASTGTPNSLTVQNDNTSGSAVNFLNDASFNVLRYATFRGASTTVTVGVINFGTGVVTGNDSNTIEYSQIGDAATKPVTLVQARGSFDNLAKFNNGNVFDHCELFNFYFPNSESNAFKVSKGNTEWRITNNSIYRTSALAMGSIHYSFNWNRVVDDASNTDDAMAKASLNNMVVTGNYFGGSAAQCGGAPWKQDSSTGQFCSYFNIGDQVNSTFSHNTFTNFDITSLSTNAGSPGVWNAIQFIGGKLDIDSNIIGSLTDSNAIQITTGNGGTVYPIAITGAANGTYSVKGNVIGGIKVGGRNTNAINIFNIFVSAANTAAVFNIDNNDVGSAKVVADESPSSGTQLNIGISNTANNVMNIRNNKIHNLHNRHTATGGSSQTIGIRSTSGVNTITGNIIDSLQNTTAQTGSSANAAVIGISLTSTNGGSLIEQNTIHSMTAMTYSAGITGIYYAGGANDVINRNLVHSLAHPGSAVSVQNGIQVNGGTTRLQNNMIRLGIDAFGQSQNDSATMSGLAITGGSARTFFNSVYIGGTGAMGTAGTYALRRTGTGTDSVYNNIFMNERFGGSSVNYAVSLNNNTNLKANYNLYYVGSGPSLGLFNGVAQAAIGNWKIASGVDASSNAGNPAFGTPAGDISTLNLHITGVTPVEGSGLAIAGIDLDFDGDLRSSLSPTDIGADAGNFTLSDIFAPAINYTNITTDTVTGTLILNDFATITDPSSVDVSVNAPRLYYKKTTDNNAFSGNSSFDNGWKYVTTFSSASPFSFVIDYSILFGGAVVIDDTIQYFVVAQDMLGNVGSNPGAGFAGASVSGVTSAPTSPSMYRIKRNPLNGSYNIGAGQVLPNFTSIKDAVFALGDAGVGSPVTFMLVDPVYSVANGETFPLTINEIDGASAAKAVTFKPATGVSPLIAGNGQAIFKLNGADYVTFDGSNTPGGTTRDLTLVDSASSGAAVIWLASKGSSAGATNVTVKNINMAGNSYSSTSTFGVFSAGQSISNSQSGAHNHNLSVINNKITNVGYGVYANGGSGNKHNNLVVSGNLIGDSAVPANTVGNIGVYMLQADGITISDNTLLNIASNNSGSSPVVFDGPEGIVLESGAVNAVINDNIIERVAYTGTGGYGGKGIDINTGDANSNIEIRNNMLSNIYGDGWSSFGDGIVGIRIYGNSGNVRVYYNTVMMSPTSSGGTTTNLSAALYAASNVTGLIVKNNILFNPMFNSTTTSKAFAIALDISGTTNYTIDYNNYFVSGSQGILGYKNGTDVTTLATWKTTTNQDVASKNVNVNFASATDLHLAGASNGDFNLVATPLAGITTDIDGNIRSATYPYMGADEASNPLPVRLTLFKGDAKGENVQLTWTTASETNNKGFDVERSSDGKAFTKVGFVKGAGNSVRAISYQLTDANAFRAAGSNTLYYRLKQTDLDGKYTYSSVIQVSRGTRADAAVEVYPNPFEQNIQLHLFAETEGQVSVSIYNISGQHIHTQQAVVNEGASVIEVDQLSALDKGIYFVHITLNGKTTVKKLVKN